VPGLRIASFEVPVIENGERVWKEMKEVDTSGEGAHPHWPDRFFAQIVNAYLARMQNKGGRVGYAHCFLFDAKGLLALALEQMRATAAAPLPDRF
jgi:aminoglycoside N3'-acetyltransferase